MKKRIIAMILCVLMLVGMLPASVLAEDEDNENAGQELLPGSYIDGDKEVSCPSVTEVIEAGNNGKEITLNWDCIFNNAEYNFTRPITIAHGNATIQAGSFNCLIKVNEGATLSILGGEFGSDCSIDGTYTIEGGTFSNTPNTATIKAPAAIIENNEGKYVVSEASLPSDLKYLEDGREKDVDTSKVVYTVSMSAEGLSAVETKAKDTFGSSAVKGSFVVEFYLNGVVKTPIEFASDVSISVPFEGDASSDYMVMHYDGAKFDSYRTAIYSNADKTITFSGDKFSPFVIIDGDVFEKVKFDAPTASYSFHDYANVTEENTGLALKGNDYSFKLDIKAGYHLQSVLVNGTKLEPTTTPSDVNADHTYSFTIPTVSEYKSVNAFVAANGKLTFDVDGGNAAAPAAVTINADPMKVTLPTYAGTKDGYTFTGWMDADGKNYDAGSEYTVSQNGEVLKANWKAEDYTLAFDLGDGPAVTEMPASMTAHMGDEITLTAPECTDSDYKFIGYICDSKEYKAGDIFTMPAEDVTMTAKWQKSGSIKYKANDANGTAPEDDNTYFEGDEIIIMEAGELSYDGHKFAGWFIDDVKADGKYTAGEIMLQPGDRYKMPAGGLTLYALWSETYSVKYNGNDATGGAVPNDAKTYIDGETVTVLGNINNLEKTGYVFSGWTFGGNTYAAGATFKMDATQTAAGEIILTANWTKKATYTVNYNANGGAYIDEGSTDDSADGFDAYFTSASYEAGASVSAMNPETGKQIYKKGYTFIGWKDEAYDIEYKPGVIFEMPAHNVVLTAQWKEVPKYDLTFDANGGEGELPAPAQYAEGDNITAPDADPTRDGYLFQGWKRSDTNAVIADTASLSTFTMPSRAVTLIAQWKEKDKPVIESNISNIHFKTGSEYEFTVTTVSKDYTDEMVLAWFTFSNPSAIDKLEYKSGDDWFVFGTDYFGPADTGFPLKDLTSTFRVTFKKGGDYSATISVNKFAAGPQKGDELCSKTFAFNVEQLYTVTYNMNDGAYGECAAEGDYTSFTAENIEVVAYSAGESITAFDAVSPKEFYRDSYEFKGWNNSADGTGEMNYKAGDNFTMPDQNVVLYAQWEKLGAIVYDLDDGEYYVNNELQDDGIVDENKYHANDIATLYKDGDGKELKKSGYVFKGWVNKDTGAEYAPGATFAMPAEVVVMTAQWTKLYTVHFVKGTDIAAEPDVPADQENIEAGAAAQIAVPTPDTFTDNDVTYYFNGWKNEKTGAIWDFASDVMNDNNADGATVTLVAQWDKDNLYYIVFDDNLENPIDDYISINGKDGDSYSDSVNYFGNGTYKLKEPISNANGKIKDTDVPVFERVDYIHGVDSTYAQDWYLNTNLSTEFDRTKTLSENNVADYADDAKIVHLYAKWTAKYDEIGDVAIDDTSLEKIGTYNTYYSDWVEAWEVTGNVMTEKTTRVYRNFHIYKGSLPDGMFLNQRTGEIYGIPTKIGEYTFTLVMENDEMEQISEPKEFSITIEPNTLSIDHNDKKYEKTYGDVDPDALLWNDTNLTKELTVTDNLDTIVLKDGDDKSLTITYTYTANNTVRTTNAETFTPVDVNTLKYAPDLADPSIDDSKVDALQVFFKCENDAVHSEDADTYKISMPLANVTGDAVTAKAYTVVIPEEFQATAKAETNAEKYIFTINKAEMSIDLPSTADYRKVYGNVDDLFGNKLELPKIANSKVETIPVATNTDKVVTISFANGIVDKLNIDYTRVTGEDAGSYKIYLLPEAVTGKSINSVTEDADALAAKLEKNYVITIAEGFQSTTPVEGKDYYNFNIDKSKLTIELTNKTYEKTYGENDPAFVTNDITTIETDNTSTVTKADDSTLTIKFAGMEFTDSFTIEPVRAEGEDADDYAITLTEDKIATTETDKTVEGHKEGKDVIDNYEIIINYTGNKLTINKLATEFKPNEATVPYGKLSIGDKVAGTFEPVPAKNKETGIDDSAVVKVEDANKSTGNFLNAGAYTYDDNALNIVITNSADPLGTADADTTVNYAISYNITVEQKELTTPAGNTVNVKKDTEVTEDNIKGLVKSLTGVLTGDVAELKIVSYMIDEDTYDDAAALIAAIDTSEEAEIKITITVALEGADKDNYKLSNDTIDAKITVTATPVTPPPSGGGGGGSLPAATKYEITVKAGEGGTVVPGTSTVKEGEDITFTVTAKTGYAIRDVLVDGESVGALASYTFEAVSEEHTLEAIFKPVPALSFGCDTCTKDNDCCMNQFNDIAASDWFHDGVHFCIENGIMNGVGNSLFEPHCTTTRAMIITMLYRLEGSPVVSGTAGFPDVTAGCWYENAVIWAKNNGLTKGYDDGTFGGNDPVTREQLAVFLYNYAQYKGYDVSNADEAALSAFADAASISAYAKTAFAWAVNAGLINGIYGNAAPGNAAERCQAATMLLRFYKWIFA